MARVDERMKDAILRLYRSAVDVSPRWAPDLDAIRCPALVVWPVDDPFVDRRFGRRLADRIHADLLEVDGGHWWPATHPTEVAAALERCGASSQPSNERGARLTSAPGPSEHQAAKRPEATGRNRMDQCPEPISSAIVN